MKKILFVAFFFMVSIAIQAQELPVKSKGNPGLFGKLKALKISIVSQNASTNLMGPKAKNKMPWQKRVNVSSPLQLNPSEGNQNGPRTKNAKPGDVLSPNTSSKASYREPRSMRPRKRWIH
ncbi:MAG: hypothetical protein ACK5B5_06465 [Bacteroidota bacterium]